ncbi:ferritin family protein [Cetobacterium sp.]|uniref:ferritin family protein n=1 Tax=Cetobacterium sp. TaxID=2071632 RepID=UPI003F34519C
MLGGISKKATDLDFAIQSLKEELQAVDDYNQRAEMAQDPELKEILIHNRNEEMEHAVMVIEWMRRNDFEFGNELEDYIFRQGKIVGREAEVMGRNGTAVEKGSAPAAKISKSLNIGSLKK